MNVKHLYTLVSNASVTTEHCHF